MEWNISLTHIAHVNPQATPTHEHACGTNLNLAQI